MLNTCQVAVGFSRAKAQSLGDYYLTLDSVERRAARPVTPVMIGGRHNAPETATARGGPGTCGEQVHSDRIEADETNAWYG